MDLKDIFRDWQPSNMLQEDPERAKLIRACLSHRRELLRFDPFIPFPQAVTCFTFGRKTASLPVGALFLLWDCGEPFVSSCPSCQGDLYSFGFGGSFYHSVVVAVCLGCAKRFYRHVVRNICVLRDILSEPLEGTAFHVSLMEILEVFPGQREPLWRTLKVIGSEPLPSQDWGTAYEPLAIRSRRDPESGWTVKTFLETAPPEPKRNRQREGDQNDREQN